MGEKKGIESKAENTLPLAPGTAISILLL